MTEGSSRTTPSPGMYTLVFAVPRSIARSPESRCGCITCIRTARRAVRGRLRSVRIGKKRPYRPHLATAVHAAARVSPSREGADLAASVVRSVSGAKELLRAPSRRACSAYMLLAREPRRRHAEAPPGARHALGSAEVAPRQL